MNALSFQSSLQKACGLPRKLSRRLLPWLMDFEENNDICVSSKKEEQEVQRLTAGVDEV